MEKCPTHIADYMHDYLDGDLDVEKEKELKTHLQNCSECNQHFHELEKAICLVQSTSHISAPSNFSQNVLSNLPKEKKSISINRWFRANPLLVAASIFLLLMGGSFIGGWQDDNKLSFSNQPNLLIENNTVIVPQGETIDGDVVVRNGNLQVDGEVKGNVIVINGEILNGEKYLASAGTVTGEIQEINELFEYLWFTIKDTFSKALNLFQ